MIKFKEKYKKTSPEFYYSDGFAHFDSYDNFIFKRELFDIKDINILKIKTYSSYCFEGETYFFCSVNKSGDCILNGHLIEGKSLQLWEQGKYILSNSFLKSKFLLGDIEKNSICLYDTEQGKIGHLIMNDAKYCSFLGKL